MSQKTKEGKKLPRHITAVTPTRIPDDHLHAIGYVTHQWTLIELILERLCVMFLQLPPAEGRLVFGRMDTLRKLDILDVLVQYRLQASVEKDSDAGAAQSTRVMETYHPNA